MFLAVNEILKEKSRFILIVAVIILVSYLTFFLTALAYGLASSYTQAIDKWDASGIILNENSNNNIARSLLFKVDYENILSNNVAPLGVGAATINSDSSNDVSLFGIDTNSFLAPEILSGTKITNNNEVLVSNELEDIGVNIGELIYFQGSEDSYKVVGFVDNASFQASPVIYMTLDAWRAAVSEISGMTGMRDDTTVSALVTRGEEKPGYNKEPLSWQTIQDFSFELPGYRPQVLTFSLMIGFLIAISSFVLAIFIYILTIQKSSIFGVLKAEGISSGYIGRSVMAQVLILTTLGLAIGLSLALLTGLFLAGKVPFLVNWWFFAGIISLFILCSLIGGIASVRSVSKIDPVRAIG